MDRAADLLDERNLSSGPVSEKFLKAFVEGAAVEEDEGLQHAWAGLLASAALPGGERVAYAHMLSELEALDARILDRLNKGARLRMFKGSATRGVWATELGVTELEVLLAFGNLRRLGLVWINEEAMIDGSPIDTEWSPDAMGRDFWLACLGRPQAMAIINPGPS